MKRTITGLLADDKDVYQGVRWTTDEREAGDYGELSCAHLNEECKVSCKISKISCTVI